eukprot:GHUV01024233.1.p1 GENE.GHUV01024233.1~~GHUV01024233.1.p1  ORF type:complete len:131 (+),score=20.26 GHUV01024233.1:499-891(+)
MNSLLQYLYHLPYFRKVSKGLGATDTCANSSSRQIVGIYVCYLAVLYIVVVLSGSWNLSCGIQLLHSTISSTGRSSRGLADTAGVSSTFEKPQCQHARHSGLQQQWAELLQLLWNHQRPFAAIGAAGGSA